MAVLLGQLFLVGIRSRDLVGGSQRQDFASTGMWDIDNSAIGKKYFVRRLLKNNSANLTDQNTLGAKKPAKVKKIRQMLLE